MGLIYLTCRTWCVCGRWEARAEGNICGDCITLLLSTVKLVMWAQSNGSSRLSQLERAAGVDYTHQPHSHTTHRHMYLSLQKILNHCRELFAYSCFLISASFPRTQINFTVAIDFTASNGKQLSGENGMWPLKRLGDPNPIVGLLVSLNTLSLVVSLRPPVERRVVEGFESCWEVNGWIKRSKMAQLHKPFVNAFPCCFQDRTCWECICKSLLFIHKCFQTSLNYLAN